MLLLQNKSKAKVDFLDRNNISTYKKGLLVHTGIIDATYRHAERSETDGVYRGGNSQKLLVFWINIIVPAYVKILLYCARHGFVYNIRQAGCNAHNHNHTMLPNAGKAFFKKIMLRRRLGERPSEAGAPLRRPPAFPCRKVNPVSIAAHSICADCFVKHSPKVLFYGGRMYFAECLLFIIAVR